MLTGAAMVVALTGCGSGQPVGALNVAESYLHDVADARYDAACGLFTDDLRRRLGDCAQAVRHVHDSLPVGERDELRYVRVRKATYKGDQAQVYPADITTDATPTAGATGKANAKKTVHSIAANQALNGQPLVLKKVGDGWQIAEL